MEKTYLEQEAWTLASVERRVRQGLGLALLSLALLFGLFVDPAGIGPYMSALVFFLLVANGTMLLYQSQTGVCPLMAARGERADSGFLNAFGEKIESTAVVTEIRQIAKRFISKAGAIALVATVLYWVLVIR